MWKIVGALLVSITYMSVVIYEDMRSPLSVGSSLLHVDGSDLSIS